jgi:pimeloyl-ACP methyl ester carboxylesterase
VRGLVDTPHGQLHYREAGSGDPPLVLFHPTPRSSDNFAELMPLLAPHRRVVALDTLGYGGSDHPPKRLTIEGHAGVAVGVLDALGIERAVVIGQHTGSKTAVEVAAAYPERVDRLVLLGPYYWREEERQRGLEDTGMWSPLELKADGSHLLELWRENMDETKDAALNQRLVVDALQAGPETFHDGHWASASYAQAERLPAIRCPTLIVWDRGDLELHDRINFHRDGIAEAIADVRVVELGGPRSGSYFVNHMANDVAAAILRFLA